jgi:hypothetical protein
MSSDMSAKIGSLTDRGRENDDQEAGAGSGCSSSSRNVVRRIGIGGYAL